MTTRSVLSALVLPLALAGSAAAQTTQRAASPPVTDRARVIAAVDSIVAAALQGGRAAGMSVAVVRGHDTLVLRGYGMADLELHVPTPDRAVYEIGSVTKQFTASAILQLVEQGKVRLDDDITTYLPGYDTQGHRVTVRRLMDHTSGIKSYTELPEFEALMARKLPRDSLVALFSTKPFDFAPGEAESYNNSAYFLLGLIIEKASGMTYADYVRTHLFGPAGMRDSHYCSESAIVDHRAHGYDTDKDGLRRAAYIDQTWPFSAGSLCSTAGDLVAWLQALQGGRILSPTSYRELVAPGRLNDGSVLRYAKGLAVDSLFGHARIHHGGDIPGFASEIDDFPDDSLAIVVLINTEGPVRPDDVAHSIAAVMLGTPATKAAPFDADAADYTGEYRGLGRGRETVVHVVARADGLALQRGDAPARPLTYLGGESFELGDARFTFVREHGRITKLRMDQVYGYYVLRREK